MLTRNKVDIERTVANVKDATDWGSKLVQKIYANPFVLSPLYKPTPEDVRVQSVYDSAQVFANGAMKLDDAVKTLELLQSQPNSPAAARRAGAGPPPGRRGRRPGSARCRSSSARR